MNRLFTLLGLLCLLCTCAPPPPEAAAVLTIPRFSPDYPRAQDFVVRANGLMLPVLEGDICAMAYATVDGPVTIEIEREQPFEEIVVRPLSAGIRVETAGNKAIFILPEALNLSVEFDGDTKRPLFLFTAPTRKDPPREGDPRVHFYGAGKIHRANEIVLRDNETLYLEPGAVVEGWVRATGARNIKILGSGLLDQTFRDTLKLHTIHLRECRDVVIQDLHLHNAFGWTLHPEGCNNVLIENHKQTGWRANCDGIDINASHDVTVRDCFLRSSDDCIAVKNKDVELVASRGNPGVKNVLVENCVLWNAVGGNALEVGFELRGGVDVQNIVFRDCDVIRVERGAVVSVHNAGTATVDGVTFEDIRIEDARDELLDIYIGLSIYSLDIPDAYSRRRGFVLPDSLKDPVANDNRGQWMYLPPAGREIYSAGRGHVRNVTFRNLAMRGDTLIPSIIKGWTEDHRVDNVLIENLTVNGKRITTEEELNLHQEYLRNFTIR